MYEFDLTPPEIIRAKRLLSMVPGEPPIMDGAMLMESDIIFDMGTYSEIRAAHPETPVTDLGEATVVPGLLNAHVHMGLSHLHGAIETGLGFAAWVLRLLQSNTRDAARDEVEQALKQMADTGVCFVADIAPRNAEKLSGIFDDSGFFFMTFIEHILYAEPAPDADFIPDALFELGTISAAAHAPYSTGAGIIRRIKKQTLEFGLPFCMHLSEHQEETDMLMGRDNAYLDLLCANNIPMDGFRAPMKSPVAYARELGVLDETTLAVHCVTVSDSDIAILAETGTNVCLCPRSNDFIGVGRAPWEKLVAAGVNCCLGTDSLASNHDLNLWNEVRFMAERWQGDLSLEQAVSMITVNPARAMGAMNLGQLAPGKAARYAVVPSDVEEFFADAH